MPETDATQQGVSKRDRDMEALIKAREEESGIKEPVEPEIEPEPEPEVEMVKFVDGDQVYEIPATAAATLKIDGEEVETPVEQITRRYQKGAAGDKRLQEANQRMRQVEAKEQALTQKERDFQTRQAEAAKATPSDEDEVFDAKAYAEAIVEADEEKIAEMTKLARRVQPVQQPVDVDSVVDSAVESKLAERDMAREVKAARDRFQEEYKDLADDPALLDMANQKTIEIQKAKPNATPWEIISEAAESVKEWKADLLKTNQPKRKKTKVPTPASGRAKIGEDAPPPPTRKDIINEIRAQRGQPPL